MPESPSPSSATTGPATKPQPQTSEDTTISSPNVIDLHDNHSRQTTTTTTTSSSQLNQFNLGESQSLLSIDASAQPHSQVQVPTFHVRHPSITPRSPASAGLQVDTGFTHNALRPILSNDSQLTSSTDYINSPPSPSFPNSIAIPIRGGWQRSSLSAASMPSARSSPGSIVSSPMLAAMTDLTPLPSPLVESEMSHAWAKALHRRDGSAGSLSSIREEIRPDSIPDEATTASRTSPTKHKKKAYGSLITQAVEHNSANAHAVAHARNRSLSEFTPEELHNTRPRNVTLPSTSLESVSSSLTGLHREPYLAEQRGLLPTTQASQPHSLAAPLPTPPASNRSVTESECAETCLPEEEPNTAYLVVRTGKRKRHYRPVRPLGQGTFSKVVLATDDPSIPARTVLNETSEPSLNPKHLVAIKIVEHGPAGGADEERVELSLKREVKLLKSVSHPSIIQLKAFDFDEREALLVLSYCPGGDLFDLASGKHHVLQPNVVQRIFAELVDAVAYLHSQFIVHRDLKLENVLLNVNPEDLISISSEIGSDPRTFPHPLITVTDLGLSRHIPQPPESPLLTTRCGSEDYAAPEILLAQPYDGRQTDAWALGVLLYALMEWRLPFDAPPVRPGQRVARGRSKAAHRIARCEWMWCRFGNDDGDWDASLGQGWEGGQEIVKNLLKKVSRGRWSVDRIKETEYYKQGIQVQGGITKVFDLYKDEDTFMSQDEEDSISGAEERANRMEVTPRDEDEE